MKPATKRLERMRANPVADWTMSDVAALCREFGVACERPPRGSHYKVRHPAFPDLLTIPFRRPIKPRYIQELIKLIDAVRALP